MGVLVSAQVQHLPPKVQLIYPNAQYTNRCFYRRTGLLNFEETCPVKPGFQPQNAMDAANFILFCLLALSAFAGLGKDPGEHRGF